MGTTIYGDIQTTVGIHSLIPSGLGFNWPGPGSVGGGAALWLPVEGSICSVEGPRAILT